MTSFQKLPWIRHNTAVVKIIRKKRSYHLHSSSSTVYIQLQCCYTQFSTSYYCWYHLGYTLSSEDEQDPIRYQATLETSQGKSSCVHLLFQTMHDKHCCWAFLRFHTIWTSYQANMSLVVSMDKSKSSCFPLIFARTLRLAVKYSTMVLHITSKKMLKETWKSARSVWLWYVVIHWTTMSHISVIVLDTSIAGLGFDNVNIACCHTLVTEQWCCYA